MIFQREKALWRYASKNHAAATDGRTTNHPPQQQHRHQRPHHPQTMCLCATRSSTTSYVNCCNNTNNNFPTSNMTTTTTTTIPNVLCNTPVYPPASHQAPPPYCSVSGGLDSSDMLCTMPHGYSETSYLRQQQQQHHQKIAENSVSAGDLDTDYEPKSLAIPNQQRWTGSRTNCSNCESSGDDMLDESEQMQAHNFNRNNNNSNSFPTMKPSTRSQWSMPYTIQQQQQQQQPATTTTFVMSAANMFRNCCGRNCVDTSISSSSSSFPTTNNNNISKADMFSLTTPTAPPPHSTQFQYPHNATNRIPYTPRQYFKALMKPLKSTQQSMLLKAVKSRLDQPSSVRGDTTASSSSSSSSSLYGAQTQCILIPRMKILDEEPHVITCRLFLWPDLQDAAALKRLPVCPNERDPVYECCNPLHWCRILETDTAPPPYQNQSTMERLKREEIHSIQQHPTTLQNSSTVSLSNNKNICQNSNTNSISVSDNNSWFQSGLCIANPESLTTNEEERRTRSSTWCEVAYWELAQRVGDRYFAKKSSINIHCDGPSSTIGDDMCLRELVEKKSSPSPDDVQHTRRKIGLGVTLSQEADGIWLYNRSTESIFVYSPTVNESWYRVCKVETGDCLKAFDSERAQNLVYPMNFASAQLGPVDVFSIRISFAKGWGSTYKRQDITRCPCWLEVIFNQR